MREQTRLLKFFVEIDEAIRRIERRFNGISSSSDFISSDDGLDRLDGISMMLIAISENIRKIEKILGKEAFENYSSINWTQIKGIRNILAHAYFDADHSEIYEICSSELEILKKALGKIRKKSYKNS